VNQVEEGFLFGETEPAPHSRREVFSLKVASEERCLPGGNPTVYQAEEVIFKDQGIDLLGSRVSHGGGVQSVELSGYRQLIAWQKFSTRFSTSLSV